MDNSCEFYAFNRLILRYDYDGAMEILDYLKLEHPVFNRLVLSCQRSLNFNFSAALQLVENLDQNDLNGYPGLIRYVSELDHLVQGQPTEIFNELMKNLAIQLEREAYTDFLGRIFQLRGLLYKYSVIQFKLRKTYSLRDRIYQKQAFEHQFKLYHGLMNGMKEILRQGGGKWQKIVNVLSGKQMSELMDLRHRTIVAHGIETAALRDIERIYESPDRILQDLFQVFQWLNIAIKPNKYKRANQDLIAMFTQLTLSQGT